MTKTKSQVYRERNMYAATVAVMAASVDGFDSGYYFSDGRWPVVWLQHDDSQAGVHVPPHMESLLDASPLEKRGPPGGYDGHSRRDRLNYLIELVENGVSETQSSD